MSATSITPFRSRLAVLAVAASALAAALPAAASAAPDDLRPTKVGSWTVTEGEAANLRVRLACERGLRPPCTYVVDAIGLTAKRPADFSARTSPTRAKLKIKRAGRAMVATVAFTATDDAVCEGTEIARVRVLKRTRRDGARRDYGTVTIEDDDCETPPTPQPAPPAPTPAPTPPAPGPVADPTPAFPADAGAPTVTTTTLTNGTLGECRTPAWIGTSGLAGADGFFQPGCAVKVACPPDARTCKASAESRHTLERAAGEDRVSLNSRVTAFSASGTAFFFRDGSSTASGFTRNEDTVMIRGGESARVECNGVRITPSTPNRSTIGCSLTVERAS